jgi:hypothetical protein
MPPTFGPKSKIWKWCLASIGAVLVGALGSGLWQSLLGPIFQAAGRGFLSIISFEFHGYKNSVYQQIALDNPSAAILPTLGLIVLTLCSLYSAGLTYIFIEARYWKRKYEAFGAQKQDSTPPLEDLIKKGRRLVWWLICLTYVYVFMVVLFLSIQTVVLARLTYVNGALAHYHQSLKIAAPYVDSQQRLLIESRFAQIRSREDYVNVVGNLETIARDHGQYVPEFSPW